MNETFDLKMRRALPEDLEKLLEFEQRIIEEERPYNDSIRKADVKYYDLPALLNDPDACIQIAEIDGRIIGCGSVRAHSSRNVFVHDQHTELGFMYVEPEFRGRGINRKIVDSLFAWSKERGIHDIYLKVYSENRSAIRAYEKAGFKPLLLEMKLGNDDQGPP